MPRPGWYRDPERTSAVRWWDGAEWTAWQSDSASAPYPPPGPVETVPAKPSTLTRRLLLGGGAVAAVGVGLTAYGMSLDAQARERALLAAKPSSLGSIRPGPQEGSDVVVDTGNRVVRWSRLFSAEFPGAPFELTGVFASGPLFASYASAFQTSEPGWSTKSSWWPSSVTVAVPKQELIDPTSLAATAGAITNLVRNRVGKVVGAQDPITTEPVGDFPGHLAERATTRARFSDDSGGEVSAQLRVTVLQAHPLAHLAWIDLRQDKATPATTAALDASYRSIWVA